MITDLRTPTARSSAHPQAWDEGGAAAPPDGPFAGETLLETLLLLSVLGFALSAAAGWLS